MKITFLGTGAMTPTKERNHSAILLNYKQENILVDCGEGTQRQLLLTGFSPNKLTKILITHWHGDHVLGLPGLIQNLAANQYTKTLEIFGPPGTIANMKKMFSWFSMKNTIKYKVYEIKPGIFYRSKDFKLKTAALKHSILSYGYRFIENDKRKINLEYVKQFGLQKDPLLKKLVDGKDIIFNNKKIKVKDATKMIPGIQVTIILDTGKCPQLVTLAKKSDVLICEATHDETLEKLARKYFHLTTKDAGEVAKKAKVKMLYMTHISQRYKDPLILVKQAQKYFKNTAIAHDFLSINV